MWQPGNVAWLSCLSSPVFSSDCLRRASSAWEPSHHWTRSGVVSCRTWSTHSATAGARCSSEVKDCGAVAIAVPGLSACPGETEEYSGEPVGGLYPQVALTAVGRDLCRGQKSQHELRAPHCGARRCRV